MYCGLLIPQAEYACRHLICMIMTERPWRVSDIIASLEKLAD